MKMIRDSERPVRQRAPTSVGATIRKLLGLFEPQERWTLAALCAVVVVVALIQTLGVASIMPFMSLVANPAMVTQNAWMGWVYESFGFESTRAFLLFAGLGVLGMMALSNASSALEHWLVLRFAWTKQHRLAVRLLDKYLQEPYTFFLDRNTTALGKNILAEVGDVINGVLMPLMKAVAQGLVVLFVFALLVVVDVKVALAAGLVLGGTYALIFAVIKRRQRQLGKVWRASNSLRFKAAAEALGSIKETKVLGREGAFLSRFAAADRRFANAHASNAIVADIPRYALETVAFGGILLMVLYFLYTREDFGQAVALLSLYAVAGLRLMPALQHVFRAAARARFFLPALDSLYEDLHRGGDRSPRPSRPPSPDGPPEITFERGIILEGVTYRYPTGESDVVKGIDLEISKNTSVAFVGSTGCGKTTLVDLLLGLLEPQQGTIRVDGTVLSPETIPLWRQRIGYVPQHIYLSDDTVMRNIAFGLSDDEIDRHAVERAARIAHLHEFVLSLPDGYDTVIGERGIRLSGGQRQRIGIARALYHDPQVLIMDEATSALDGITEEAVIQAINDLAGEHTIVLVAHRLSTVRDCDAVYLFEEGQIVAAGTYRELMQTNPRFRAMAKEGLPEAVPAGSGP